jgi:hypothetical protein
MLSKSPERHTAHHLAVALRTIFDMCICRSFLFRLFVFGRCKDMDMYFISPNFLQ